MLTDLVFKTEESGKLFQISLLKLKICLVININCYVFFVLFLSLFKYQNVLVNIIILIKKIIKITFILFLEYTHSRTSSFASIIHINMINIYEMFNLHLCML